MEELKSQLDFCIDQPDSGEYSFQEYLLERGEEWRGTKIRLEEYFKVLNQKLTPMCSYYWVIAGVNMNNIREDLDTEWQIVRDQIDPTQKPVDNIRNLFTRVNNARKEWLIEWFVSIARVGDNTPTGVMTKERRLKEIKTAIGMWYPVITWTYNVKRTHWMSPILKMGDDNGWHIFCLSWKDRAYKSTGNLLKFVNSFGKERWDEGYWYIKEEDIDKLFTCYVLIDKQDSEFFKKYKANRKVMELITKGKEVYQEAVNSKNLEAVKYLEWIQLSKSLTKIYKL